MYIDEQSKMNINGVPQFVSIRAEKENRGLSMEKQITVIWLFPFCSPGITRSLI